MDKQPVPHKQVDSQKLADLLNHNTDWIWETDAEGHYVWVSDVVKNQLGYSPEEVLGRTPFDFMAPGEAERLKKIFVPLGKKVVAP